MFQFCNNDEIWQKKKNKNLRSMWFYIANELILAIVLNKKMLIVKKLIKRNPTYWPARGR